MNCNQAVAFVRLNSDMADPAFVCYVCSLRDVMAPLLGMSAGGAIQNLNLLQVRDLSIPLPPLPEQKRIAAILTEQMATIEKARTAAEARLKAAKELPAAYLREVFESEEAKGWPRRALGDVLTRIEAGKSFQTTERLAATDEVGVLKVSAVTWADFRPQEAKATEGNYEPAPHHRVRKGDILITRANTKELVGAVVHVDTDYPNRLLSDKTLRLVVDEARISHGFLLQALRMPDARKHIEGNATGTSDSMRNIAQDTIKAIPLPLPPLGVCRT
jgi:type I restriction enzyme S subunit